MRTYSTTEASLMLNCNRNTIQKRAKQLKIKKTGAFYKFTHQNIVKLSKKPSEILKFEHVRITETYYIYESKINKL